VPHPLTALATILLLSAMATPASACRCAQNTLAQYFQAADRVMQVEIEAIREISRDQAPELGAHRVAEFTVLAVYKADAKGMERLKTPASSATCGLTNIKAGDRLWVFAHRQPNDGTDGGWIHSCSGTRAVGRDFQDVPAAEVACTLEGLRKHGADARTPHSLPAQPIQ